MDRLTDLMKPAKFNSGFSMDGYWIWCGSVVLGDDGKYHMFASRWKKSVPMHPGWLLYSEIVRATSDTPAGPYEFQEVVLPMRGAEFWDGRATHNPHIMKIGDTYVLYYVGITYPFEDVLDGEELTVNNPQVISARANKRIGVATSKSVFGPWKRSDTPILQPRPMYFDNFFTSNPAPCLMGDDEILLVYKSRSYKKPPYVGQLHGDMKLGVAIASQYDGSYKQMLDTPLICEYIVEDPFIWRDNMGYNMMAKDVYGHICGEANGGALAISMDGLNWAFKKDYLFYSRDIMFEDGKIHRMGNLERPFLLFEDKKPICAFFATSDGTDEMGFGNCTKTWNMAIELK